MNTPISIDKAIAKGHIMINYPVVIIMWGTIAGCFYLGNQKIAPFWIIPMGFVLGFILAWLYWSIMITKWRLWAFENVCNVHELKERAVQEKLIWPDHSIFEKTEIRSASDKERWRLLQTKFDKDDEFISTTKNTTTYRIIMKDNKQHSFKDLEEKTGDSTQVEIKRDNDSQQK
jgi:hypothetical protein